ncbi:MAG TPA: Dam family site-specific DNA-(adenine-N6)-methyltransferase [Vicinamibacterales bacterium]|jgi:DNA adenine methylase
MHTSSILKPPLKWAGGKRWQLPYLRPLWRAHAHRRLVEPFCGGLAVALGLMPARALLNDSNPHLINFYCWLRKGLTLDIAMVNERRVFDAHRQRFNELLSNGGAGSREAAALFYYLNRTGYNGLCRFNRSGVFNVPFGRYQRIRYATDFSDYRDVLSGWTFSSADVEAVGLDADDFVYADPPYDVDFTQYGRRAFTWPDQERTAVWLSKHGGPVLLVNQATHRVETLYRKLGYRVEFLTAPRRISSDGDRTPVREIVAMRNL